MYKRIPKPIFYGNMHHKGHDIKGDDNDNNTDWESYDIGNDSSSDDEHRKKVKPSPARCVVCSAHVQCSLELIIQRAVFLCHTGPDKEPFVRPLYEKLQEIGILAFFDRDGNRSLPIGSSFPTDIFDGLSRASMGVIVMHDETTTRTWPTIELDYLLREHVINKLPILRVYYSKDYKLDDPVTDIAQNLLDSFHNTPFLERKNLSGEEFIESVVAQIADLLGTPLQQLHFNNCLIGTDTNVNGHELPQTKISKTEDFFGDVNDVVNNLDQFGGGFIFAQLPEMTPICFKNELIHEIRAHDEENGDDIYETVQRYIRKYAKSNDVFYFYKMDLETIVGDCKDFDITPMLKRYHVKKGPKDFITKQTHHDIFGF